MEDNSCSRMDLWDLAVTRGSTAFITCRFRGLPNGKLVGFHFKDHFDCLMRSCEALGLNPCPRLFSLESLQELIKKKDLRRRYDLGYPENKETVVRIYVTSGESYDTVTTKRGRERFFILQDFYNPPSTEPLKLKLIEGAHQAPEIKITGKYAIPKMYRDQAREEGFDDILFWDDVHGVTESFSANFFLVGRNDTYGNYLITPSGKLVLEGVTRSIICTTLARRVFDQMYNSASCLHLRMPRINGIKEAFLTSTTRGIAPIESIIAHDGTEYVFETGTETLTTKLQRIYNEYVENYFQEKSR